MFSKRLSIPDILFLVSVVFSTTATADENTVDIGTIETLIQFNAPDTPASITIDSNDNAYIATGFTGKICKVNLRQNPNECEPFFTFPINDFPEEQGECIVPGKLLGDPLPIVLSVFVHPEDDEFIYASVNACTASNHGVWRINAKTGEVDAIYNAPHGPGDQGIVLNGITVHNGVIYGADYFFYKIWSAPVVGTDSQPTRSSTTPMFSLWSDDALFTPLPASPWQGPNGLKGFDDELYVAVSGGGNIVKCNIETKDCSPHVTFPKMPCCSEDDECATFEGDIETIFGAPEGSIDICATPMGCDEFDFDKNFEENGIIICSTDPYGVIVLLDPTEGEDSLTQVLLNGFTYPEGPNLDGPSSVAFGRTDEGADKLYITNAAFQILPPPIAGTDRNPSLMVVDLTITKDTSDASLKCASIAFWITTITTILSSLAFVV